MAGRRLIDPIDPGITPIRGFVVKDVQLLHHRQIDSGVTTQVVVQRAGAAFLRSADQERHPAGVHNLRYCKSWSVWQLRSAYAPGHASP